MSEAVTVPSLMMMTFIVSEKSLAAGDLFKKKVVNTTMFPTGPFVSVGPVDDVVILLS